MDHNYAYVTLLTNDSYLPGVIILSESLRRVKNGHLAYPLVCLVTEDVSEETKNRLGTLGIDVRQVEKIPMPEKLFEFNNSIDARFTATWKDCFTKFHAFELDEFDKVIFCDADLLILKNVDHCFDLPHMTAALDGEYSDFWHNTPHFNAGFIVIKPEKGFVKQIMSFIGNLEFNATNYHQVMADQEILNLYYAAWPEQTELHLDKYYNVFPNCSPNVCYEDMRKNAYFVHFVGVKPWQLVKVGNQAFAQALFTFTAESTIDSYCIRFYEEACCIATMSSDNSFNPLDWDVLLSSGEYYAHLAIIAWNVFRDVTCAKKMADLAVVEGKGNETYAKLASEIDSVMQICSYIPVMRALFAEAYKVGKRDTYNYFNVMRTTAPFINIRPGSGFQPYTDAAINLAGKLVGKLTEHAFELLDSVGAKL